MPRKATATVSEATRERLSQMTQDEFDQLDPRERAQLALEQQLITTLGELGGSANAEDSVVHRGDKLVVPATMTKKQAAQFLIETIHQEEEETNFSRSFNYRPLDGAWCTWNALKRTFGAVGHTAQTVQGFFGPIKIRPDLITVPTGPHTTEQVPWGTFTVPFLPGVELTLGVTRHNQYGEIFHVEATGPRKYRHQMEGIFKLIERELKESSIYRGKAIDGAADPNFIDLTAVERRKVHYTEEVQSQLEANINSPIMYSSQHRKLKLPLKRAVLIHGPYGCGKTLAAYLTGQVATNSGWTFLYARPGEDDLVQVMQTARLYQPAVVFYEDMDNIAGSAAGEESMTRMLDIFDGITAKGTEILVVLTTNHKDRIHKAMLRPGRLDAVIEIGALDRPGVEAMIKSLVPKTALDPNMDYDAVYEAMKDLLPAFIREAIDRTTRYALTRAGGESDNMVFKSQDLVHSAQGLIPQLEMMNEAKETRPPDPLNVALSRETDQTVEGVLRRVVDPSLLR